MKIHTARFSNPQLAEMTTVAKARFTQSAPRFRLPYPIETNIKELAPPREIWKLPEDEFCSAYQKGLDRLGVPAVRAMIEQAGGGRDIVLLCFEDIRKPGLWCHRRHFAQWWERETSEVVEELAEPIPVKGGPKKSSSAPSDMKSILQTAFPTIFAF